MTTPPSTSDHTIRRTSLPINYMMALGRICQGQWLGQCGNTSLSSALVPFGVDVSPKQIRKLLGKTWSQARHGFSQKKLVKAAEAYGFSGEIVWGRKPKCRVRDDEDCQGFRARLNTHVKLGRPAILSVDNHEHWVAIVGSLDGNVVVMDPDVDNVGFSAWTDAELESRTHCSEDGDGDEHLAILLSPKQGVSSKIHITREVYELANSDGETSGARLGILADDLFQLLVRSGVTEDGADGPSLHVWMQAHRSLLLENVAHWVHKSCRGAGVNDKGVAARFDSYQSCAAAFPYISIPDAPRVVAALLVQFSILLVAHATVTIDEELMSGE